MNSNRCPNCGSKKIEPSDENLSEWWCSICFTVFLLDEFDPDSDYDYLNENYEQEEK